MSAGEVRASRKRAANVDGDSGTKNGIGADDGIIEDEDGVAVEEEELEAVSDDAHAGEVSE